MGEECICRQRLGIQVLEFCRMRAQVVQRLVQIPGLVAGFRERPSNEGGHGTATRPSPAAMNFAP